MNARVVLRIGLAYLVFVMGVSGAWALFFPASFWDTYPGFGLEFLEPLPAYNEHLINDFGTLYLALATILLFALVRPARMLLLAALAGMLVYGVPHFVFHITHLQPFDTAEVIAQVFLVGSFVAVPAVMLVMAIRGDAGLEAS